MFYAQSTITVISGRTEEEEEEEGHISTNKQKTTTNKTKTIAKLTYCSCSLISDAFPARTHSFSSQYSRALKLVFSGGGGRISPSTERGPN